MTTETTAQDTGVQNNTDAVSNEGQNAQSEVVNPNVATNPTLVTSNEVVQKEGQEAQQTENQVEGEVQKEPLTYEDFSLPEGMSLDKEALGKFQTVAKELNLSQENAQKLVDIATEQTQSLVKKQQDQWLEVRKNWVNEIKNDQEFGGEKFTETIERAKRTLKEYGSEEFLSALEQTGFGDNPEMVKLLARLDKAMSEDTLVDGAPTRGANQRSAAQVIYGKTHN